MALITFALLAAGKKLELGSENLKKLRASWLVDRAL
jgi:hypothetical protein